ncbi:MAG: fructose-specific PTS transporter subunit EIIC, partial [Actinobacteria bacterium]|nr:fructose-specific PTS transporter subunit EIIC [Actinomycetota bacterium]
MAVTSCPTGIAHTYMAAESLEEAARKRGWEITVETQGSGGAETVGAAEISSADVVVFAADAAVNERERFADLPSVEVGVGVAINRPDEVLDKAGRAAERGASLKDTEDQVPASEGAGGGDEAPSDEGPTGGGGGERLRQWLMTGVGYMIPFVVAGGILIALSFLVGGSQEVVNQNVYEEFSLGAMLFKIGDLAFNMLVPILAGFIAYGMADRPGIAPGVVGGLIASQIGAGFLGGIAAGLLAGAVIMGLKRVPFPASLRGLLPVLFYPLIGTVVVGALMIVVVGQPIATATDALTSALEGMQGANAVLLGLILGAMMAFDMGGPINKVAYVFATGLLASQIFQPMAAVMAAGMTPPLGLALATALRGRLFPAGEQEAGKAAWVMGASFITEGAIPFAAADP